MANVQNGNCYLCGAELGKVAMKNHIIKRHSDPSQPQDCCLLKVEGAYDKNYWLYLDMPLTSTLSSLDRFLRKIWLECCGHMSGFMRAGYQEIGKGRKLGSFAPGEKFLHQYDFGDTTELLITVIGRTQRKPQREAVRLLARNIPLEFQCGECGKLAEFVCPERYYEDSNPFFCRACAEKQNLDFVLPITNSPRMGVCGYTGELDTYAFVPADCPENGKA